MEEIKEINDVNDKIMNAMSKPMTISINKTLLQMCTNSEQIVVTNSCNDEETVVHEKHEETVVHEQNEETVVHEQNEETINNNPPKILFIVPYRDREQQLIFFNRQIKYVLEDLNVEDYRILFIHQCDKRQFNRGAIKNIGFLVVRDLYPTAYRNITLVFNDIDTMPYSKNFLNYETKKGIVKHFYGYKFALGGIVSIKAGDFEWINGFPNFWAWGFEDNMLNTRVLNRGLLIDRTQFYPITDKNILQFHDGMLRNVNRTEFDRYTQKTNEGWNSIKNLKYTIDTKMNMVNVSYFETGTQERVDQTVNHDLRKGNMPFKPTRYRNDRKWSLGMQK